MTFEIDELLATTRSVRKRLDFERLIGLIDLFELGVDVGFADVKHTAFSVCAFEPQVAVASE